MLKIHSEQFNQMIIVLESCLTNYLDDKPSFFLFFPLIQFLWRYYFIAMLSVFNRKRNAYACKNISFYLQFSVGVINDVGWFCGCDWFSRRMRTWAHDSQLEVRKFRRCSEETRSTSFENINMRDARGYLLISAIHVC